MHDKSVYGHQIPLVLAIVGPTGIGKSEVATELAARVNGEIVSADSMQVYKETAIGTAKPKNSERGKIPHHMVDVVSLKEDYSVARFQKDARKAINDIQRRGKIPVVVGGSGLYVRAVIDKLIFPPRSEDEMKIRRELEKEAQQRGTEYLYKRLKETDPEAAAHIHPNNERRIIRALEVSIVSGKRFSDFPKAWENRESIYDTKMIGLKADKKLLNEMIDKRVEGMFDAGLLDEVGELGTRGLSESLRKKSVLGYVEVLDHLEGRITLDDAKEKIKQNTRRFARRQMTWFNADTRIKWFERAKEDDARTLADRIESYLRM